MHVALLTSANGWRGSGVSYAKLAHGEEGLEVTEIPGGDTGLREVLALRRTEPGRPRSQVDGYAGVLTGVTAAGG